MIRIIGVLPERAKALLEDFEGIEVRTSQDGDELRDVDIPNKCLLDFKYSQVTEMLVIKDDNFKVFLDVGEFHYFSII